MAKDAQVRVEIAFEGGRTVGGVVSIEALDALRSALAGGEAVYDLETDDGTYSLALAKIAYVKRSSRETQIGFGAAA